MKIFSAVLVVDSFNVSFYFDQSYDMSDFTFSVVHPFELKLLVLYC